jgi:hypothetical protein
MHRRVKIAVGVVAIAAAAYGAIYAKENFFVALPEYPSIGKAVWLPQNWSPKDADWYHHADQGTVTFGVPYEWFTKLEQPTIPFPAIFSAAGRLADASYLDRYGFIPGNIAGGNSELPIGFAGGTIDMVGPLAINPQTKKATHTIGLTCAACHTGRFTHNNTTVLIDGGPALTNLGALRKGLALSLIYTRYWPQRFDRFATNVLGDGASDEAKKALKDQLQVALGRVEKIKNLEKKVERQAVTEGFARLDALNRIGNQVFSLDLTCGKDDTKCDDNYTGTSAPVHYPRVWNAPWFLWVQYNGSIEQPMVRNAGEALGVSAQLALTGDKTQFYQSSVQFKTLHAMENLLAGNPLLPDEKAGFPGLAAPKWPEEILGPIDNARAMQGAALYKTLCQDCHLPPVNSQAFWQDKRWLAPNAAGQRFLDLEIVKLSHIGTDPAQAIDMARRTVWTPDNIGITFDNFGSALGQAVENAATYWYDHQTPPEPEAIRDQMNGFRKNGVRAPFGYKVRPLNGIWATPPYLHNGSVPNLYALLSPVSERPKTFYLGNRDYDPVNVGYRTDDLAGGFKFDTTIRGNYNTGHEFNDDKTNKGVIGRTLKPDERRALVEYLKTL